MNETIRTAVYVAAGLVAAVAAFATRPVSRPPVVLGPMPGTVLFPKFTDPLEARSLDIQQYDEANAKTKSFRVEERAGIWVIPSHGGYPADAADQLKSVSETLSGLTVLGTASMSSKDHELFGVVDPTNPSVGATGVGTLITLANSNGDDVLSLIVGKAVEGALNQHFVRKPKEDVVTVAKIDLTKLPTEFEKWIEKDLLKVSTWDVSKVFLKDYAILPTVQGATLIKRMEADLGYDSGKGEWALNSLKVPSRDGPREMKLGEQEELNKQKLDDLRNALGDLKIVDVKAKPEGLGNSLRVSADKLSRDQMVNLQKFGFYPQPAADGSLDIYGANGEVLIETKDGVLYFLRFGDIADTDAVSAAAAPAPGGKPEDEKVKIHRYLFVTTQVAPSVLELPKLEEEPAAPATVEPKPAEPKPAEEAGKADASKTGEKAGEKGDDKQPPVIDPQQAEREAIKNANKRKMDAYNDKKKKAEVRVKELNARFAGWYYVVAEDVYKKIRLGRSDIVKESTAAKDEGFGLDAFRTLEQGGVQGAAKPAAAPSSPPSFPGLPMQP
jgi:uncharacterized protein DUF4340